MKRLQLAVAFPVFFCFVGVIFQSLSVAPRSESNSLDAPTTIQEQQTSSRNPLFYNVFFKENRTRNAIRIIEDQLSQIRESNFTNATIYYNTIGFNKTICPADMNCRFLNFYPKAHEEVTLHSLYEYCVDHPRERVSYLHNKGSFSQFDMKFLRIHATKAALSDKCASPCNVCGMMFQTAPYFHFSSNMWTAECSYVQQLVPPLQYEQKRRDLCRSDLFVQKRLKDFDHIFCPDWSNYTDDSAGLQARYGFGRYAMERWIVSHPSLRPCQLFPGKLGSCKTCDWETKLLVVSRRQARFPFSHWQILAQQLVEYEFMYDIHAQKAASGEFCQGYFQGHSRNPCSLKEDAFNISVPYVMLS
mmetsp:Transcript_27776/g.46080  ORF Transcript_27776/g.46080 Transcript_27776/m.46080 type:complete len:359 (+) Transcript_27776:54-1130(+)